MNSDSASHHPFDPAAWALARPSASARVERLASSARLRRVGVLVMVVLGHLLLFNQLRQQVWSEPTRATVQPMVVVDLSDPVSSPAAPPPAVRLPRDDAAERRARRHSTPPRSAPPDPVSSSPAEAKDSSSATLRLYRPDGSLALPDAVVDGLATVTGSKRRFSFQMPGLVEAQSHMPRPAALAYEGTRFEEAWIEETDPITAAMKKAVEKTTLTVRIPLPRAPGSKLVCAVSLAAMAGGCGFRNESDGYVVRLDDPDTLDSAEVARCESIWNEVVQAKTPEQLRVAQDRYEAQCRKPQAAARLP